MAKVHEELNSDIDKPLMFFEQQRYTSEEELLSDAIKSTFTGLMEANTAERKDVPVSKLVIGVECGGSDGFQVFRQILVLVNSWTCWLL